MNNSLFLQTGKTIILINHMYNEILDIQKKKKHLFLFHNKQYDIYSLFSLRCAEITQVSKYCGEVESILVGWKYIGRYQLFKIILVPWYHSVLTKCMVDCHPGRSASHRKSRTTVVNILLS